MSDPKVQQNSENKAKAKAAAKAERRKQYEAQMAEKSKSETSGGATGKKSKAELKAERRLKQEAERAAKTTGDPKQKPAQNQPDEGKKKHQGEKQTKQPAKQQHQTQQNLALKKQTSSSSIAKSHDQPRISSNIQMDSEKVQKRITKNLAKQNVPQRSATQKKVQMFSHLHQYEKDLSLTKNIRYIYVNQ